MAKAMGGFSEVLSKAGKEFGDMLGASVKGKKINGTNKAINAIGNNFMGVPEVAARVMGKAGHQQTGFKKAMAETFKPNGKLDYGKIAGSYIGVSAAARVASGGGLYKDRNGNTNIAGVPFI